MEIEFINALHKLLTRWVSAAESMWLFSAESVSNERYIMPISSFLFASY